MPFGYLAGWWHRVGATIVDGLVVGLGATIVLLILGFRGLGLQLGEDLIVVAYQIAMLGSSRAQTLGNMAVSTRVADAATGGPIGHGRSAARSLVTVVLGITIVGGILDILWPLWDRQCQTLHDKAAGSVVLKL